MGCPFLDKQAVCLFFPVAAVFLSVRKSRKLLTCGIFMSGHVRMPLWQSECRVFGDKSSVTLAVLVVGGGWPESMYLVSAKYVVVLCIPQAKNWYASCFPS